MSVFDRDDFLFYFSPGSGWTAPVGGPPTFSRASVAHRVNRAGVLEEIEADYPRRHWGQDENGLWRPMAKLEAARTNELHNSTSPATQTRSLAAGTYTLWVEGTGSVDADGATDGAYGTATEGQANDLTFTVSATQDVTFTVTGTVDVFQCELGSFRSSLIETAGASGARSADSLSFDISGTPLATPQESTYYIKFVERGTIIQAAATGVLHIGSASNGGADPRIAVDATSGGYRLTHDNGSVQSRATLSVAPSYDEAVELRCVLNADGSVVLGQSIEGGAESIDSDATTATLGGSWADTDLVVNRLGSSLAVGFNDFISLKVASGVRTMDEMRALAGTG